MSKFYDLLLAKALAGGGGGGPTNFIEGEFTTQATEGAQTITIPYEGSGYPIALVLFAKGGTSDWYTDGDNKTVGAFYLVKYTTDDAPIYSGSGDENRATVVCSYKNNTGTYGQNGSVRGETFYGKDAIVGYATCVRFKDNVTMSVFVTTGSGYGLAPETDYVYELVYSE